MAALDALSRGYMDNPREPAPAAGKDLVAQFFLWLDFEIGGQ
jgi:hypothetical protein